MLKGGGNGLWIVAGRELGEQIEGVVDCRGDQPPLAIEGLGQTLAAELEHAGVSVNVVNPGATPDQIMIVPGLPKTRSGKIMRRILRNIAAGEYTDLGDITTLADPPVVEKLVEGHKKLVG